MKVAILRDHNPDMSIKWELACKKRKVEYLTIDLLRNDWLEIIKKFNPTFCVSRPPGDVQQNKKIFEEKIFFLEHFTNYKVFPGFLATNIYENKSALNWFLVANNIPHPKTFVSSDKIEAINYIKSAKLPIVAKTFLGAAGSGVKIFYTKNTAYDYVKKAFKTGIKRRYGPNRKTGSSKTWLYKALASPQFLYKKIKQYNERNKDVQKNMVLFQEHVCHDFEWRIVKIGKSFFAYKKLKIGDMASGAKKFEYGVPPLELLDYTRELCDKFNFCFMTIDFFYFHGQIYVNEMQTIFGHKNPYICRVEDKIGRYIYENGKWKFEEGDFNSNESYDLRLDSILENYI